MNRGRGRPTFESPYAPSGSWSTPNSQGGGRGGNWSAPNSYGGGRGGGGYQQRNNYTSRGGNNWTPRGRGGGRGWRGGNNQNSNRGGWNKNVDSSKTPAQAYVMPQMSQNPWQKLEEQYKADFGGQ